MHPLVDICVMQPTDPSVATDRILESLLAIGRTARKRLDTGSDQVSYWVVHMLAQLGPSRNGELAAVCGLDASTVSRQIRHLEDVGIVERHQDPADGRAQLVSLSSEGERRVAEAKARRLAIVSDRLAGWSHEDVCTLAALLSRLAREIASLETREIASLETTGLRDDSAYAPSTDLRQD